jgi:hypothetical protein
MYEAKQKYLLEGGPGWQWHHRSELAHAMWRGARVREGTPEYLHPSLLSGPLNHPNLLQVLFKIIQTLRILCLSSAISSCGQLLENIAICCVFYFNNQTDISFLF